MLNNGKTKPFKSYEEQLALLESRGLKIEDREKALSVLKSINYYRFSGYSLTLRRNDTFYHDITFDDIYELYMFDEQYRSVMMKYCGIVEVTFRSYISYYHAGKYSPTGYLSDANFDNASRHKDFIENLKDEVKRSDDYFIDHHKNDLNSVFPFWVVIEVTSFGVLSKLYKNLKLEDRSCLARQYVGVGRKYVENWLQCCSYTRNIAAHGGRFYNRLLKACPVKINKKRYPGIDNTGPFAFVIAIYNLLPSSRVKKMMKEDLVKCFSDYPFSLPKHLKFPNDWETLL
ncbi:MAG: Abi family protein [Lachnospiraceae bacterium]|nr:Abi family protein [Lachnospiraceae bacterium]